MESELEKLRIQKQHKSRRDERSRWPWVLLLALLIGGGYGFIQWRTAAATILVQTVRVRVPDVSVADSSNSAILNATGYITAAHKIELASKVIGRVAWVGVEMGDKVKKDQVLVRLEDDEYRARAEQRKAELATMQAKLSMAEGNWQRAQKLGASEALAQTQFDQYKADYDIAKATVGMSQASLDLATLDLQNTTIRAPIDSTILSRNVEVGEFVTTGFVGDRGAKGFVVSIADLDDLRVELDISQNDFAKVAVKQPCWVTTDAYPDRKYNGIVDLISPEANRQKATVQVRVKVVNPDQLLRPDMNATVAFLQTKNPTTQASQSKPAIRIPAAVVREGSVFVVENGKVLRRTVTTGQSFASGEVEIRDGLIGGEDLVVSPPATLKDGDSVKIEPPKT